jgi:DNA-binding transcriptional ArsR family regulator
MPKSSIHAFHLGKQRHALVRLVIRLCETARDDGFPDMATWDFFMAMLILERMYEQNQRGREASASELSRSTGIPRTTMRRKLRDLARRGAIERRGHRFVITSSFFNSPFMLRGFRRRSLMVKQISAKLGEHDSTTHAGVA